MSFHSLETGASLHTNDAFTYADAAARTGATGLTAADQGKIAKQSDTGRRYILLNHSPVTWSEVTAPANGGGGINYISDTTAEDSVGAWVAYADAAGVSPVDGTGGSPVVTITRSTSSPLRGSANYLITKDAANRQGNGVSIPFSIDRADLSKMLQISFDLEPTTGFVASSGEIGSESDLEVYLYDVTNSVLIPVVPNKIITGVAVKATFNGFFQADPTSTSYRLILHVATTSATAWTVKFDNVRVGPVVSSALGSTVALDVTTPGTPSLTGTPSVLTWSTITNDTHGAYSGTAWTCPVSGYYNIAASTYQTGTPTAAAQECAVFIYKNGSALIRGDVASQSTSGSFYVPAVAKNGVKLLAGDTLEVYAFSQFSSASIVGDSGRNFFSVSLASASGNGLPGSKILLSVGKTTGNHPTNEAWLDVPSWDTPLVNTGSFDASTGIFTVPESGDYLVTGAISFAGNATGNYRASRIWHNNATPHSGAEIAPTAVLNATPGFSKILSCVAGDTIRIQANQDSGGALNYYGGTYTSLSIYKVSGVLPSGSSVVSNERNTIINGGMDIWQRGTSFSAIADSTFYADRFKYKKTGTMVHTITQDTDVPTNAQSKYNSLYSQKLDCTTAQGSLGASDYVSINNTIEGFDIQGLIGGYATLSFWVKAVKTGTYSVSLLSSSGSHSYVTTYNVNTASTWEKKVIIVNFSTTGITWDFTSGRGLDVQFNIASGSTVQTSTLDAWQSGVFRGATTQVNGVDNVANDFFLTQVRLSSGVSDAQVFRRAGDSIGGELALCQRYFEKHTQTSQYTPICTGFYYSTTSFQGEFQFITEKRIAPTLSFSSGVAAIVVWESTSTQRSTSGQSFAHISTTKAMIGATVSGATAGAGCMLTFENPNNGGYLRVDAEI